MFSQIKNISIGCILLVALGCVFQTATATEEELLAVHDGFRDALNAQDVEQVASYFLDDAVYDYVPLPTPMEGKEAIEAFFEGVFQGFPDFHVEQRRKLAAGNNLVTECTVTATHQGEWMGIPATGNSVQLIHMCTYDFEGDKIKRHTTYDDAASQMMQLGVMPAPKLDPALLVPSFTLPEAEPPGLTPLEADAEARSRWNTHDLSVYAKVVHRDAEVLIAPLGLTLNRDAYVASQELYFLGFPDLRMEAVRTVDMGGGWVLNEVLWKGTHTGLYFDILATGRPAEVRGGLLGHYDADGLITNLNVYFDNLTLLAQLGLFPPPDPEANKALLQRYFEEVANKGDLDLIDEMVAPDYVGHMPEGEAIGIEGAKQHIMVFRSAFPDLSFTYNDMIAEGDEVAVRYTVRGTHEGTLMGIIPPTGKQITMTGVAIFQIVGGKIVGAWSIPDMLGAMQQLGVMPLTREDYTWGAPSEVTGDPGAPQANTALVLYIIQKFWNQKNVSVLSETHSADSVAHNPVMPVNPLSFDFYKQACLIHVSAFPDMQVTTDDIIAEGDKVVIRWTVTGTHQAELMGIPASGRQVTWSGFTIYRFADGKIVESWWAYDALDMVQQVTPPTPEPPEE